MRDPLDVIAQVINGHGPALAGVLEVSVTRCNEILSTDNPYPKAKRLIRAIAQLPGVDVRPIKADLDAMFAAIVAKQCEHTTTAECTRECFEAIQGDLEEVSPAQQRREWLDVIALASRRVAEIDGITSNGVSTTGRIAENKAHATNAVNENGRNGRAR